MNACKRFSELFSDYAENTMLPEQRHAVEVHLSVCADCQAAIARLQHLRSTLSQLTKLQTPPDFEAILRARMRRESKRTAAPGLRLTMAPMPRFAVFALVAMLVFFSVNLVLRQQSGAEFEGAGISSYQLLQSPLSRTTSSVIPLTAQILYTLDKFSPKQWPLPRQRKGARSSSADSLSVNPDELPHGPQNSRAALFSL
ncbi:MAG: anti-sigma factor family protein [bacterium]